MLLVVVATENEIGPLKQFLATAGHLDFFVAGMGPVAAAVNLSHYLAQNPGIIDGVINIGIGGAYHESGVAMLDLCVANNEVFGDFGICLQDEIMDFDLDLMAFNPPILFDETLTANCMDLLKAHAEEFTRVNFVTVNSCSGTKKRGEYLREKFEAGCENMEGAGVAMVCNTYNIPCAELRCISNMVEDRNTAGWKIKDAIEKLCRAVELILNDYPRPSQPTG